MTSYHQRKGSHDRRRAAGTKAEEIDSRSPRPVRTVPTEYVRQTPAGPESVKVGGKLSSTLAFALAGPARYEEGPPEAWERLHDRALEASDTQPIKGMPTTVLLWEKDRDGEAMP